MIKLLLTKASRKPQLTTKFALSSLWLRQTIKIGWFAATTAATKGSRTSGKGNGFIFKLPNHPADFLSYPNFFVMWGRFRWFWCICGPQVPTTFRRGQHHDILSNARKSPILAADLCPHGPSPPKRTRKERREEALRRLFKGADPTLCPCCKTGHLLRIGAIPPAAFSL